ncbi:MAG: flagellin lysine-N-methylase [Clostridia bacterium]|nr:flagellin lysine-N-methylase [Clostridia bacterium]
MTIITPNYYKKFKCIADKCKHSCCIGWEIEIDDVTAQKYKAVTGDFSSRLNDNIDFGESPFFKLDKNERCPFLNQNGLCDIITNLGEDMLCQICTDHPRFRNYYGDYEEIGLGMTCEAATEIILTSAEKTTFNIPSDALEMPLINFREKLFNVLQDRTISVDNRVDKMLALVDAKLPNNDWYGIFSGLERLDNAWDEYLVRIKDGIDTTADTALDIAYEQLLVYLIYRHFLDVQYDEMLKERVLFAALIYKVAKKMNVSNTLPELIEIARLYSSEIEYSDENINVLLSYLEN